MELRGTVLNVVDFGAFVDVGLSDSGLIHISQLSAGYVRDPHDIVAVGDQVRVWVASIDKDRRRVALTMIAPGTERPHPPRQERGGRRRRGGRPSRPQQTQPQQQGGAQPAEGASAVAEARPPRRRDERPRRDRDRDRGGRGRRPERQPRSGAYEKRAEKTLIPITKAMEEGKEMLRSFGDLLQFHQKKKERVIEKVPQRSEMNPGQANANGASEASPEPKVEDGQPE
jgi:uncharacterized protein